jgi:hypothetical protein
MAPAFGNFFESEKPRWIHKVVIGFESEIRSKHGPRCSEFQIRHTSGPGRSPLIECCEPVVDLSCSPPSWLANDVNRRLELSPDEMRSMTSGTGLTGIRHQ